MRNGKSSDRRFAKCLNQLNDNRPHRRSRHQLGRRRGDDYPGFASTSASISRSPITLATRSWAKGLFADAEFIDDLQVHEGSGLRSVVQQVRQWRKGNFDLAVLLPNSLETALVASLARVPLRIGYATDGRQSLLTHPLDVPEWRASKHEVFYYLKIVAELEWLIKHEQTFLDTQPDGSLEVSVGRKSAARDLLRRHGVVNEGRALVALCPGSINSRAKRWPSRTLCGACGSIDRRISCGSFTDWLGTRRRKFLSKSAGKCAIRPRS